MLLFFFCCRLPPFTPSVREAIGLTSLVRGCEFDAWELDDAGAFCRLKLKLDMNSRLLASSPNKFFRCSAAASFGSVFAY